MEACGNTPVERGRNMQPSLTSDTGTRERQHLMASLQVILPQIKEDVGAVGKTERNNSPGGNYNFRGIDAVINAVAPALIAYGVTVIPKVTSFEYGSIEAGKARTPMGHARVIVEYTFHGPDGDTLTGSAPGEAMDSGDKATPKAMSVAYRTFLLQALSLPTNEPDPDAVTYSRTDTRELEAAVSTVQAAWAASHDGVLDMGALAADYAARFAGANIREATADTLRFYATLPLGEPPVPATPPTVQEHLARATTPAEAKA